MFVTKTFSSSSGSIRTYPSCSSDKDRDRRWAFSRDQSFHTGEINGQVAGNRSSSSREGEVGLSCEPPCVAPTFHRGHSSTTSCHNITDLACLAHLPREWCVSDSFTEGQRQEGIHRSNHLSNNLNQQQATAQALHSQCRGKFSSIRISKEALRRQRVSFFIV